MKLKDPKLKPLMIAAPSFRPLKAVVVVAAASPAKSVDDLKGKSVALPNGIHETARLFAEAGFVDPVTGKTQPAAGKPLQAHLLPNPDSPAGLARTRMSVSSGTGRSVSTSSVRSRSMSSDEYR